MRSGGGVQTQPRYSKTFSSARVVMPRAALAAAVVPRSHVMLQPRRAVTEAPSGVNKTPIRGAFFTQQPFAPQAAAALLSHQALLSHRAASCSHCEHFP
jgi:hypothetical protein